MLPTFILALIMAFLPLAHAQIALPEPKVLAVHEFSLEDRYPVASVNDVFKDNILLAIDYTEGLKINPNSVDWKNVEKPFEYKLALKPGETFAFHDDVLPQYTGKVTKTTNADFSIAEGFKSDGYLAGDGVCHLASLLYWVAKDAGLDTYAPTRHDFANIPEVPEQFGVSIYDDNTDKSQTNEMQNLYITNNKDQTVTFVFNYNGKNLSIKAEE
ncbi:MAG TPA: VanW family protein [Patescibacteria group bacterium]|nr:VanW family protein [Patescibacteria group bacterium]